MNLVLLGISAFKIDGLTFKHGGQKWALGIYFYIF